MKSRLLRIGGGLAACVMGVAVWRSYLQRATASRIKIVSPAGVASIEQVRLGGVEQWIQIRGDDRAKPILLFLHSGPGFPEMPFSHVNAALEREFVVVQWDQRGAGKSYSSSVPESSMTIEQFISDTHELTQLLLQRFGRAKLILVAHSWGSIVGAFTVARHPELFEAYVGISQAVNPPESERMTYRFALETAVKQGNEKAAAELRRLGEPPYKNFSDYRMMKGWVHRFRDAGYSEISPWKFARLALSSPAYSWSDLMRLVLGMHFSFSRLWQEVFYRTDMIQQAPELDVPVYFFLGRHDRTVTASAAIAERYFNELKAPKGKHLSWFEKSGHWPQLEEPEKFRTVLTDKLAKTNLEAAQ
ncbi:MAG: alpha/beta hydrolase [Verrucomicrobia bacterium]|nr:MAG: alpha/beta hydrolase [Verrucomicrobiota bacterium]